MNKSNMPSKNTPDMYYFCADHPFSSEQVTIGGLAMTALTVETVTENLKSVKTPLSWSKISQSNLNKAQSYIEEFCRLLSENKAHFHLRFTSTQQVDVIHKMELSEKVKIAHLYYHLILQRAFRFYSENYDLHIRPENENVRPVFEDMRERIHKDSFDLYGSRRDPITSLETTRGKDSKIIQMLDLALGAITTLRHRTQNDEDMSEPQRSLISTLEQNYALPNLMSNSGAMEQRFSVWNDEPSLLHTGFRGLL